MRLTQTIRNIKGDTIHRPATVCRIECAGIPKDKELVTYQTGVQNAAQCVQGPGWIPMTTDKS